MKYDAAEFTLTPSFSPAVPMSDAKQSEPPAVVWARRRSRNATGVSRKPVRLARCLGDQALK